MPQCDLLSLSLIDFRRLPSSDRIIGTTRVSLAALPSGTPPESGEEDWKVVNVPHNVFGIGDTLEEVAEGEVRLRCVVLIVMCC